MNKFIIPLVAALATVLLTGCSGATPGFMTPSKPQSGSADPSMDPFEREGARLKETPSPATVTPPPAPAPKAAQ
jgi:hypothetical protein